MKKELVFDLSNAIEEQLSEEYRKRGIETGDISPEQAFLWDDLVDQFADLFLQLIENNTQE